MKEKTNAETTSINGGMSIVKNGGIVALVIDASGLVASTAAVPAAETSCTPPPGSRYGKVARQVK